MNCELIVRGRKRRTQRLFAELRNDVWDQSHSLRQPLGGVGIGERAKHLEAELRQAIAVVPERQLLVVLAESEGTKIVRERVALGSELHADEGPHWDVLEALYTANRNQSQSRL